MRRSFWHMKFHFHQSCLIQTLCVYPLQQVPMSKTMDVFHGATKAPLPIFRVYKTEFQYVWSTIELQSHLAGLFLYCCDNPVAKQISDVLPWNEIFFSMCEQPLCGGNHSNTSMYKTCNGWQTSAVQQYNWKLLREWKWKMQWNFGRGPRKTLMESKEILILLWFYLHEICSEPFDLTLQDLEKCLLIPFELLCNLHHGTLKSVKECPIVYIWLDGVKTYANWSESECQGWYY